MAGNVEPRTENRDELRTENRQSTCRLDRINVDYAAAILRLWQLYAVLDFTFLMADLKLALTWYISDGDRQPGVGHGHVAAGRALRRHRRVGAAQVVFMLGYATIVSGLINMFFGYNVLYISRRLGRGQLDHTLIQPQPIWMSLLTEGFMPFSGSPMLLPGVGAAGLGGEPAIAGDHAGLAGAAGAQPAASSAVVLAFSFLWGSLAFWAPRAAEEINSSSSGCYQLKPFPLDGLGRCCWAGC